MEDNLLEISGDKIDGGELVGRRPFEVASKVLSRNFSAQKPHEGHSAECLDCCCGNASRGKEVHGHRLRIVALQARLQSISKEKSSFLRREATAHCAA